MTGDAFPVHDEALTQIEHALGPDPEFGLPALLDFYAGHDPSVAVQLDVRTDLGVEVWDATDSPAFHPYDVIEALVAEVRRLRSEAR